MSQQLIFDSIWEFLHVSANTFKKNYKKYWKYWMTEQVPSKRRWASRPHKLLASPVRDRDGSFFEAEDFETNGNADDLYL